MPFCTNCGKENPGSNKFCTNCGAVLIQSTKIIESDTSQNSSYNVQSVAPITQQSENISQPQTTLSTTPQTSNFDIGKWLSKNKNIIFSLVGLAILVWGVYYFFLKPDPVKEAKKVAAETKEPKLKEETVSYKVDSTNMNSFVVYDESIEGKRPAVLVIHEWWGMNDYTKMRARELAKLGYIAMAIDMYGNGKTADNPGDAQKMAMPFYQNPQMAKARFDAALNKIKTYSQVDTGNIAGIGYCFGGGMLLNLARLGEDLEGVVSFHGSLLGTPAVKELLTSKILVCHGAADSFVPQTEVDQFKKQMDSIGADYTFKVYEGATHAFTNPDATGTGKKFNMPISYNAAADSASWKDMREFFGRIFK